MPKSLQGLSTSYVLMISEKHYYTYAIYIMSRLQTRTNSLNAFSPFDPT